MKQKLVVGARVEHKEYGEGVIVQVMNDNQPYLVKFDNQSECLHSGGKPHEYPDKQMWWCDDKRIKLVTPKSESQQLADILVKLGYEHLSRDDEYIYMGKRLKVFWCDGGVVQNIRLNGTRIANIHNESIATNIAYFQKKLNKKLKKAAAKQVYAASVEPVCKPHDVVIPQVEELVNTRYFKLVPTKAFHDLVAKFKKELFNDND